MSEDRRENAKHDEVYRQFFSVPRVVRALIEHFVDEELARALDFEQMEQIETTHLTPMLEKRESDLIWKIPRQGGQAVHVLLMLEFQSGLDTTMANRLMVYTGLLFARQLDRDKRLARGGLPPVLPIVIHSGSDRWTAPRDVFEMIAFEGCGLPRELQPRMKYHLISLRELEHQELLRSSDPVSVLFALETAEEPDALEALGERVAALIARDEVFTTLFTSWINYVFVRKNTLEISQDRLRDIFDKEDHMPYENLKRLAENLRRQGLEQGLERGIERGIAQGREEGERRLVARQLELKFGPREARAAQLGAMTIDQLERLAELLLIMEDEDELFASLEAEQ